ncbi:MAG: LysR family transcriptional regulator [Gammaproteobacteria bacterium]|nr:LysR family transcriptional regulator [Gammaproteobacteria bacterium]
MNDSTDHLNDLAVFVRVVEEGSFTRAAERLEMSQSVVSKCVSRLEMSLKTRLLQRTTRRLRLTEGGEVLYRRARSALEEIAQAQAEVAHLQGEPAGRLRVTCPLAYGMMHVAPAVVEFLKRWPKLSVELDMSDRRVDLLEEGVDVAIRVGWLAPSSLVARKLAEYPLVLCASPDYLARHGRPQAPHDLSSHNCILYTLSDAPREWHFTTPDGTALKVEVRGNFDVNNGAAQVQAALAGLGVIHIPGFYVTEHIEAGRLEHLLTAYDTVTVPAHALYPARRFLPLKVKAFVDFLAQRVAQGMA